MLTVDQCRDEIAPYTLEAGKCRDSIYVLNYINQARMLLYPRGNWIGTLETERINSFEGLITLPNRYVKILNAKTCSTPLAMNTEWHEIADNTTWDSSLCRGLTDLGDRFASFRDYVKDKQYAPFRVRLVNESRDDAGKKVNIRGIDDNGRERTVEFVLPDADFGESNSSVWFKNFRTASKPNTVGGVRAYIYDPNESVNMLCSVFEAQDQAISMRRYRDGYKDRTYYVRCKRRYIPLVNENDFVEFPIDAIIQACKAITARRNKEDGVFTSSLNLALEALNMELKDDTIGAGGKIKMSQARIVTNLIDGM